MMRRSLSAVMAAAALWLAACAPPDADLDEAPVDLGDFRLGHNIVVVPDARALVGSRKATEEEWKAALTQAIVARFGRYEGEKFYHFGVSVDGYNLAPIDVPGVPTPKSALAFTVTVWDDAAGRKLNEEAKTFTVLGIFSGAGIQPTKEVQLANLSALAAKEIEEWLLENRAWFGLPPLPPQ